LRRLAWAKSEPATALTALDFDVRNSFAAFEASLFEVVIIILYVESGAGVVLSVVDQINAPIQPTIVQPKSRFVISMASLFLCLRRSAMMNGKK
jgi:hypothetical protein